MMTDEQKAIEEMAEIIQTKFACREESAFCLNYSQCKGCPHCKEYSESIAAALDKAGYRKQSDTVKEFKDKIIAEFNKYTKWDDPYCYLYEPEQQDEMFINHLSKIAAEFGKEEKE